VERERSDALAFRGARPSSMYNTFTPERRVALQVPRETAGQDPQAWKKLMGTKPVAARLELLPEGQSRKSALLTSVVLQSIVAAFVVALPLFFPDQLKTSMLYQVIPLAPLRTEYILPTPEPPKPPVRRAEVRPTPPPVKQPVAPPQLTRRTVFAPTPMVARLRPVEVRRTELPQVDQTFAEIKLEDNSEPARPREPVKTGLMTTGSAAPATITKPTDIAKVQTGGFGDERGLPGESNPNRPATIARLGSPVLPPGAGYGNGSGGATGARGTVASSGFGNGVAIQPNSPPARGEVRGGGFAKAEVASNAPRAKEVAAVAAVQPVVILEKPNPVYSEEARRLGLEGEVLIDVVFPASGAVRVVRVTKGLGHGLDEAAIRAARQIRFKPALQQGKPVDFPATVHIVFQLAF
jgi:TonB family protein